VLLLKVFSKQDFFQETVQLPARFEIRNAIKPLDELKNGGIGKWGVEVVFSDAPDGRC
jgi:hypothetical protein